MLDSLMDSIKGQVVDTLKEKTGLDGGQAEQAVPLAKDSIVEGLTGAVSSGNLSSVMSMFSGGGEGGMMDNMVYQGMATSFIGKLTSSLGIPESMASTVSSFALPMILNKLKGSASNDSGEVDQAGLMSMIGGDSAGMVDGLKDKAADMLKGKLGGLGDMASGLFGK